MSQQSTENENRAIRNSPLILVVEDAGVGGTEIYVEGLARYMAKRRPIEIVTLSGDAETANDRFPGLKTTALSGPTALRNVLRSRPGVVVNLHLYKSLWPAVRAVRAAKSQLLITVHQPLAPWNAWHRLRWRLAISLADHVIGVSNACLLGYGPLLAMSRRSVVSGPLPFDELPLPTAPNAELRTPRVLFVGRLSREKDVPTLLRAMKTIGSARLDIIGDGAERAHCEALAKELNIDVCFHGTLPRDDVFKAMQAVDIFVLPSLFEGLGIAAIEAMAVGVPTVVANFPAADEYLLPKRTGLAFPIGDHAALAQCLNWLIHDSGLRKTLSTEGSRHVRALFSEETQYGKYDRILEGLAVNVIDVI